MLSALITKKVLKPYHIEDTEFYDYKIQGLETVCGLSFEIAEALRRSTLAKIRSLFGYKHFSMLFRLYREMSLSKPDGDKGLYENHWYRVNLEELNEI